MCFRHFVDDAITGQSSLWNAIVFPKVQNEITNN